MKHILSVLFIFTLAMSGLAQPEKPIIEEIEGKKFYVHMVQEGNTLYGLTRLYKTPAEDILKYNPSAANGLQIGQKVIIPLETVSVESKQKAPETHTVKKGETLYGISRMYHIKMEDLVQLNPGIDNGISIDQVLKIPSSAWVEEIAQQENIQTQISFSDSVITYTVLPQETLYTISKRFMVPVEEIQAANQLKNNKIRKGDVIKIPVKKEKIRKVEIRKVEEVGNRKPDENLTFKPKNQYKVVYLLPFGLDGGNEPLKALATEFYMGAKLALDSLEKMGLKAQVQILDAPGDTTQLKKLLNSKEMASADIVIGPFTSRNVELAAAWAKQKQVRLISPLVSNPAALKDNPYLFNAVNSDMSLMESMARHIKKNRTNEQVILVSVDSRDMELYQAFRQEILKGNEGNAFKLIETDSKGLAAHLKKSGATWIIVPSRDRGFATKFIMNLNQTANKSADITLFATKDWISNDDIKGYYKNKFKIHFASPYDFNYSYETTKKLHLKYRSKYNADLSRFAVQGFDVSYYFLSEFCLSKTPKKEVMNEFNMQKVAAGSGAENANCYILKQEDFEIKQVAVIYE